MLLMPWTQIILFFLSELIFQQFHHNKVQFQKLVIKKINGSLYRQQNVSNPYNVITHTKKMCIFYMYI